MTNHEESMVIVALNLKLIKSDLRDYSDEFILVSGTITITGAGADAAAKGADEREKGVICQNCALFTKSISSINDTQIDNAEDIDVVIPIYNLIERSNNYSKTLGSLW